MLLIDISNKCMLGCEYCYSRHEVPGLVEAAFFEKLLQFKERQYCFHGKEPLCEIELVDKTAKFLRTHAPGGTLSVQTNGVLLGGRTAEVLIENDIHIGVSMDGPEELNRLRCGPELTEKIRRNAINFIKETGRNIGIICVITNVNVKHPERVLLWAKEMRDYGVSSFRLNPVLLSPNHEPLIEDLIIFYDAFIESDLPWTPLGDIYKPACEKTCTWRGCDPDASVIPIILPNGEVSSCLKSAPDFIWRRPRGVRKAFLRSLSYDEGGCHGCEWFEDCLGACPYEAERSLFRSKYCKVWRHLFAEARRRAPGNTNFDPCKERLRAAGE